MPFKIPGKPGSFYRPGERRNNRGIVWRGRLPGGNGDTIEIRTDTRSESAAARHVEAYVDAAVRRAPPPAGAAVRIEAVARHYKATNNPSAADLARIDFVVALHGHIDVGDITQAHVNEACQAFRQARAEAIARQKRAREEWEALEEKPRNGNGRLLAPPRIHKPPSTDTVNREVKTPYSALLHFAHDQGWRPYLRVRAQKAPETEPPRAPPIKTSDAVVAALLAAPAIADHPARRAFVLFTHERGMRISETLKLRWDWLDLRQGRARLLIRKPTPRWFAFDLSPLVVAAFAAMGAKDEGLVFTWGHRSNVYGWLDVAQRQCGVRWRPHESRRAVVSDIIKHTGDPKAAQKYVDHLSLNTTLRYRHFDAGELSPAIRTGPPPPPARRRRAKAGNK